MKSRRYITFFLSFALILTSMGLITGGKAHASADISRLYGSDRYATAISISSNGWQKSQNVVLATGEDYPDALCAAPLAKQLGAPILLSEKWTLRGDLQAELTRLDAKNIYIIGGTGVISQAIQNQLEADGKNVVRLYGSDRYATSLKVAEYISDNFNNISGVMIATGDNFPDALSAAPVAASQGMAILLSGKSSLSSDAALFIKNKGIKKIYIIGGQGVLGSGVESQLPGSERIWGRDRYETNSSVLQRFRGVLDFNKTYVATGENFPDALAGSALASVSSSPVVLTSPVPGKSTIDLIGLEYTAVNKVYSLGGVGVIPDKAVATLLSSNINTQGNTQSNINNFGTASVQGGWIYYCNYSDNQNLYKMKYDGTSPVKLSSDGGISHINVLGNWIYYSGNDGKLYRMDTNGSSKSLMLNEEIYFLYVESDWIYYYSGGALYRMKTDGSIKSKIVDSTDMWHYYIQGSYVYFLEDGNIMRVGMDGKGKTAVVRNGVREFSVSDGFIYYLASDQKLYRVNMDGTGVRMLVDGYVESINVTGNWIYYLNASENDNLYKIAVDGTCKARIGSAKAYGSIIVAGDSVFYNDIDVQYSINKMDKDGSNVSSIGQGTGYSFRFDGGWIYYVDMRDDSIVKMRTDGSGYSILGAHSSGEIQVSSGYIYYSNENDNNNIYKISTDGSGNQLVLSDPAGDFTVSGGYIYYSDLEDGGRLYKSSLDGSVKNRLSDNSARNILADNGTIYYFDEGTQIENSNGDMVPSGYGIYKMFTDGSQEALIKDAYIDNMYVSGGYLFYHSIGSSGTGSVYRMGLDGSGETMVTGLALTFNISGGNIYEIAENDQSSINVYDFNGIVGGTYDTKDTVFYMVSDSGWIYYETVKGGLKLYSITVYGEDEREF